MATDPEDANAFWESAGLAVVRRKPGGASRGRVLNIRVRDLDTPRLFAAISDVASPAALPARALVTVPSYIIDVNVFLDLVKHRAKADDVRRMFSAAWTRSVDVFVAEEFVEELRRASKLNEVDAVLEMALTLPRLPKLSGPVMESVVARLAPIVFPHKAEQGPIGSHGAADLRHLGAVVHHGMNGFVTSEKAILKRSGELRKAFGIDVVGTEEFASLAAPGRHNAGDDFRSGSVGDTLVISELSEDNRERALGFLRSLQLSDSAVSSALSPGADMMPRRRLEVVSGFSDELVGYASWDPATRLKNHVDAHVFVDEDHPDAQPVAAQLFRELAR